MISSDKQAHQAMENIYIGEFTVKQRIGFGAFGLVYLVYKTKDPNKKIYILKQIPFFGINNEELTQKMNEAKNEAVLLKNLNCKFVVKYFDSFEDKNLNLNIVMEYCEDGDLNSYLKKIKNLRMNIPERKIWKIFIQICLGLAYIHSKNIIHRDLKPMNIFLTKNQEVKIGDFGVAKLLKNSNNASTFIGTPNYLSPEICVEKPYDNKSDIWALGCILYQLCTLNMPFQASNQAALFLKIIQGKYPPIESHKTKYVYSREIKNIITRLLEKNKNMRPSMRQIINDNSFTIKAIQLGFGKDLMKIKSLYKNNDKFTNSNNINIINISSHNYYTNDSKFNISKDLTSPLLTKQEEKVYVKKNIKMNSISPYGRKYETTNNSINNLSIYKQRKPAIININNKRQQKLEIKSINIINIRKNKNSGLRLTSFEKFIGFKSHRNNAKSSFNTPIKNSSITQLNTNNTNNNNTPITDLSRNYNKFTILSEIQRNIHSNRSRCNKSQKALAKRGLYSSKLEMKSQIIDKFKKIKNSNNNYVKFKTIFSNFQNGGKKSLKNSASTTSKNIFNENINFNINFNIEHKKEDPKRSRDFEVIYFTKQASQNSSESLSDNGSQKEQEIFEDSVIEDEEDEEKVSVLHQNNQDTESLDNKLKEYQNKYNETIKKILSYKKKMNVDLLFSLYEQTNKNKSKVDEINQQIEKYIKDSLPPELFSKFLKLFYSYIYYDVEIENLKHIKAKTS